MEKIKNLIKQQPLIFIIIVLAIISCFAILNAAPIIQKVPNPATLWIKQLLFFVIGGVIIFIISKVGNEQIYNNIWWIYGILMVLLALLVVDHYAFKLFGINHIIPLASRVGGATSWYNIPGFSLQPSEFMKIVIVIMLAKMTKEYHRNYFAPTFESEIKYIMKCMGVVLPPALLIYLQNDTGVVLIVMMGVLFVLFSSGIRGSWFTFGIIFAILIIGIGAYLFVYQPDIFSKIITGHKLNRFYGWVDPEGTIKKEGFQLFYSLLSYGSAGWFGHGFQAVIKVFPEAQTDFIFAVILTCYGYSAGLITIAGIIALDVIVLKIGFDASNSRDKFFVMGIFGMLFFQQIWNMGMILGLLPITGITLPFISYGGSSLLSYMIAVGMFVDINRQNNILKNKVIS